MEPDNIEALKTLSKLNPNELTNCDKLTASLEKIRSNKNLKLFEKLDQIKQDYAGLNEKIAEMEATIESLKEVTNDLFK